MTEKAITKILGGNPLSLSAKKQESGTLLLLQTRRNIIAKEKSIQVLIKMSQAELDIIKKRMEIMNIKNKSEFIRRMAIYGYMLQLDLDTLQKPLKLMGNISNNINQIATRVNSTGNFYQEDLEELQTYYRQLKNDIVPVILELSKDGV